MVHVTAYETQPVVVEGLRRGLEATTDLKFVGAVSNPEALAELVTKEASRVCLIDNALGTKVTLWLVSDMRLYSPRTEPVLWGVEISEADSFGALQAGAKGILKKTQPTHVIVDCLRAVASGNIWIERSVSYRSVGFLNSRQDLKLTAREEEVLHLVMRGMKNKQIAQTLQISPGTVKIHLKHVFDKTGAKGRYELAMYGRKRSGYTGAPGGDLVAETGTADY